MLRIGSTGGNTDGDDVAQLLKASWRETRRAVLHKGNIAEFHFRQYMFSCQARLLLKLERPSEVPLSAAASMLTLLLLTGLSHAWQANCQNVELTDDR